MVRRRPWRSSCRGILIGGQRKGKRTGGRFIVLKTKITFANSSGGEKGRESVPRKKTDFDVKWVVGEKEERTPYFSPPHREEGDKKKRGWGVV